MRRGIVVGHRDYGQIAQAIKHKTPFHILTGFMPSGHPHLGHLMVMKEVVWHVQQGGNGYITIADPGSLCGPRPLVGEVQRVREGIPLLSLCTGVRGQEPISRAGTTGQGPCL